MDRAELIELGYQQQRARSFAMRNALNEIEALTSFNLGADQMRAEITAIIAKVDGELAALRDTAKGAAA